MPGRKPNGRAGRVGGESGTARRSKRLGTAMVRGARPSAGGQPPSRGSKALRAAIAVAIGVRSWICLCEQMVMPLSTEIGQNFSEHGSGTSGRRGARLEARPGQGIEAAASPKLADEARVGCVKSSPTHQPGHRPDLGQCPKVPAGGTGSLLPVFLLMAGGTGSLLPVSFADPHSAAEPQPKRRKPSRR